MRRVRLMFEVSKRTQTTSFLTLAAISALTFSLTFTACKDKQPEASTASPAPTQPEVPHDGVQLISPGEPPLQVLRYRLTKGDKTTSELVWDFEARSDGKVSDALPTWVLDLETTVEDVAADGTAQLRVTVTRATARPKPGMPAPGLAVTSDLTAMQGVAMRETLAPDGRITNSQLDATTLSEAARGRLQTLAQSLTQAAMRLPGEPVGNHASWRERVTLPDGGIRAVNETTYTLTSLAGSILTYTAASTATGQPHTLDQDGFKVDVTKVAGKAESKGAVDLAHYAPQVKASSSFSTTLDVHAPAGTPGAGSSTMDVTTALELAPAPPPADAGVPDAAGPS